MSNLQADENGKIVVLNVGSALFTHNPSVGIDGFPGLKRVGTSAGGGWGDWNVAFIDDFLSDGSEIGAVSFWLAQRASGAALSGNIYVDLLDAADGSVLATSNPVAIADLTSLGVPVTSTPSASVEVQFSFSNRYTPAVSEVVWVKLYWTAAGDMGAIHAWGDQSSARQTNGTGMYLAGSSGVGSIRAGCMRFAVYGWDYPFTGGDVSGEETVPADENGKIVLTTDVVVAAAGRLVLQVTKLSDLEGSQTITVAPGGSIKIGAGYEIFVVEGSIYKMRRV